MSEQAYKQSVRDALKDVEMAITEALAVLPEHVTKQHWVASRHAPEPWLNVKDWYWKHEPWSQEVQDVIDDLLLLERTAVSLRTILGERPTAAPDLTLPKTRRAS